MCMYHVCSYECVCVCVCVWLYVYANSDKYMYKAISTHVDIYKCVCGNVFFY